MTFRSIQSHSGQGAHVSLGGPRRALLPLLVIGVLGLMVSAYVMKSLAMPDEWMPLLLAGLLTTFVAVIVGNIRKLLVVVILVGISFSININLFYNEPMADLNAIGGINISTTTIALLVLYAVWIGEAVIGRGGSGLRFATLVRNNLSVVFYVLMVMLSLAVASNRMLGVFEVTLVLQMFFLYIYLLHTVRTRSDVVFIVTVLLVAMLLEALVMLMLPLIGESVTIMSVRARIDDGSRVGGTLGGPNSAGAYFTMLIAPALAMFLIPVERARKLLGLVCVLLGCASLVLTLSRGAWLGFAVAASVFGFFAWRRRWLPAISFVVLAFGALVVAFVFKDLIFDRITAPDGGAAYARWPLMQMAWAMITDHPLFGVGANNFAVNVSDYAVGPLASEWLSTVHNRYLLLWSEAGLFALIFFLGILGVTIRRGWQVYRYNDPILSPLALGFTAGVLGVMVHMNVDMLRSGPPLELFWVSIAMLGAMDLLRRGEMWEDALNEATVTDDDADWSEVARVASAPH